MSKEHGLIFIDKEQNLTSRRVDNLLMRHFGSKHVGHLGTLDPFATGLLIVGLNEGTKLLSVLGESNKTYQATLQLGLKTATADLDGEIIASEKVSTFSVDHINLTLHSFLGKCEQIPPIYSAIKIDGKPLYKYALNEQEVEIMPRTVDIFHISLDFYDPNTNRITFTSTVSKGTYIRTLGEQIAERLGSIGHLVALRRLAVDDISINSDFVSTIAEPKVISLSQASKIFGIDSVQLPPPYNGHPTRIDKDQKYLIGLKEDLTPLAIYEKSADGVYIVRRGFNITD